MTSHTGADLVSKALLILVTCITLPAALAGQGWIDPIRPLPTGRIEKLRSAVQVAVSGRVARVTVEEWFRNTGPILGEGSYLYPLPGEAAFSEFSLWQGDNELKGEMMDATQARSIYENIVRLKRDPALIELAGHGLIRARLPDRSRRDPQDHAPLHPDAGPRGRRMAVPLRQRPRRDAAQLPHGPGQRQPDR
jgi:hypothetical protein